MMAGNILLRRALLASSFLISAPIGAQTSDPQPAPAATADQSGPQLGEIVVTAERRETSLQKTPISIVAVSAAKLAQTAVRDVQDLGVFVPNLSIGSGALGPSLPTFAIRGVGQSSTRIHQEPGVALYIDDLYYPRTVGSLFQIVDLERVEVLRGPQGTLFGRNATGGAIRFVTKKPADYFEARASATVGSYGRKDGEAMVNVPLADGIAVRVQGARLTDDGYIDEYRWDRTTNTINKSGPRSGSRNDWLLRGAVRIAPTGSGLTVDLSAMHQHQAGTPPGLSVRSITPAPYPSAAASAQRSFVPFQVYLTRVLGRPASTVNDPLIVAPTFYSDVDRCVNNDPSIPVTSLPTYDLANKGCDTRNHVSADIYQGTIAYKVDSSITLKSITGYQRLTSNTAIDLSGLDTPAGQREKNQTFSQEAQALYSGDVLNVTLGVYYYRQRAIEQTWQRRLATPVIPTSKNIVEIAGEDSNFNQLARSLAFYGEATYNITPKLFLTGGVRHTIDRKRTSLNQTNVFNNAVSTGSLKFQSTDYRATLRYQIDPDISIYATTSSGYKAGGFNNRLIAFKPFNPPPAPPVVNPNPVVQYDPERIKNYELGFRSDLLDRRVRVNLTAYYMPYKDVIQDYVDFSGTSGAQVFSINGGDIHIKGIEGDVSVAAARGLTLTGSFAANDVKWTRLISGSPALNPATCPGVNPATPDKCQPIYYARAPKFSYTLGATYQTPVFAEGQLVLTANYGHQSSQNSTYSAASAIRLPAYGVLNLRAQVDIDRRFSVAGFVTNALATKYAAGGVAGADTNANTIVQIAGRPREVGLTGTVKFGGK